ncbi:DUF3828 domain-containing protein [Saccharicrinis sp. FJH62]|uniref:DUF3828 domain-containing protein n=1 Tax=Saccharicrinis sp. FJH62 TaxID=3344657 RepID=UPI0035D4C714
MRKLILIVIALLSLFDTIYCQSGQTELEEDAIKVFYIKYLTEIAKEHTDYNKVDSLKEIYCTKELIFNINNIEIDYDPFFQAQDFDLSWLENLTVLQDSVQFNQFNVSYYDAYEMKRIIIKLTVIRNSNSIKINDINNTYATKLRNN